MATRFYLPSTGAPPVSPAYGGDAGNWADTSFAARLNLVADTPSDTAMATVADTVSIKTDVDHLYRQFVSDPLTAQTILAQTYSFVIRTAESNTAANLYSSLEIRVVSEDGATVRGTLLSLTRDDTEWASSLTNRFLSVAGSEVVAVANDRIVVEIGQGGDPTGGGNHNDGTMRFGDVAASDLPYNDTETADYNPYVNFANTITFAITPTVIGLSTATLTAAGQIMGVVPGERIIGLNTATLTATGQPITIPVPGVIALIDYEEGDTSDHDSITGTVTVNTGAALVGTYGAVVTFDGAGTDHFGTTLFTLTTNTIRYRIYFEDVSLSMTNLDVFYAGNIQCDGTLIAIDNLSRIRIAQNSGVIQVDVQCKEDNDGSVYTPDNITIPTGPFFVEVLLERATTDVAGDGELTAWVGATQLGATRTNIDNYDLWDTIIGIVIGSDSADAGTTGDFRFDDGIVRDDGTEIGAWDAGGETISPTGATTPAGSLDLFVGKQLSGAVTSSGSLAKFMPFTYTGVVTSNATVQQTVGKLLSGVIDSAGSLAFLRTAYLAATGVITSAGDLVKDISKTFTGSDTPTGSLIKEAAKTFAGAIDSSGAFTGVKTFLLAVSGAITSAGNLTKNIAKDFVGSDTPTGSLIKDVTKTFIATITSAGDFVAVKTFLLAISGAITPAGSLAKSIAKDFVGAITSTGSLAKNMAKDFVGVITSAGSLVKDVSKTFTATITSSGLPDIVKLAGAFFLEVAGTITSSGSLVKDVSKTFTATITSAGSLIKAITKTFTATITPTGSFAALKTFLLSLAGTISSAGYVVKEIGINLAGSDTPTGSILKTISIGFEGIISSSGILANGLLKLVALVGSITTSGTLQKNVSKTLAGTITTTGTVVKSIATKMLGVITSVGSLVALWLGDVLQGKARATDRAQHSAAASNRLYQKAVQTDQADHDAAASDREG